MRGERSGGRPDDHLDDHTLWDAALGEAVAVRDRAHLAGCRTCTDEVQERRYVATVVADPPPADLALRPPARVLEAVRAELGLADPPSVEVRSAPEPAAPTGVVAAQPVTAAGPVPAPAGARPRRAALALAAAGLVVAGAALGAVLGVGLGDGPDDDGPDDGGTVVARAELDAVDGGERVGTAVLHDDAGRQVLDVELTSGGAAADPDGSYEEVWLLGPDAQPLVSLGVLGDGRGSFVVPAAVAADGGLVVDVSVEALDGRPGHSGESLARGEMTR